MPVRDHQHLVLPIGAQNFHRDDVRKPLHVPHTVSEALDDLICRTRFDGRRLMTAIIRNLFFVGATRMPLPLTSLIIVNRSYVIL